MKGLLRIKEVCKVTGLSNSTIWLWVKQDKFPKPWKISPKITVWNESDIFEYIQNLRDGQK
jgi:prophage regulatory protein